MLFIIFCIAVLLIAGYPVALTLAGVSILVGLIGYFLDLFPIILLNVLPNRIFGIISNETLIAVPLFIFMGVMLERSGIASDFLKVLVKFGVKSEGGWLTQF